MIATVPVERIWVDPAMIRFGMDFDSLAVVVERVLTHWHAQRWSAISTRFPECLQLHFDHDLAIGYRHRSAYEGA